MELNLCITLRHYYCMRARFLTSANFTHHPANTNHHLDDHPVCSVNCQTSLLEQHEQNSSFPKVTMDFNKRS